MALLELLPRATRTGIVSTRLQCGSCRSGYGGSGAFHLGAATNGLYSYGSRCALLLHQTDAQDCTTDADANERLELFVQFERLNLEGVEWVDLRMPTQPDPAAKIINLSKVLHPELVNAAQDDGTFHTRPELFTNFNRLLLKCPEPAARS